MTVGISFMLWGCLFFFVAKKIGRQESQLQAWRLFVSGLESAFARRFHAVEIPPAWRPMVQAWIRAGALPHQENQTHLLEILGRELKDHQKRAAAIWRLGIRTCFGWVVLFGLELWSDLDGRIMIVGGVFASSCVYGMAKRLRLLEVKIDLPPQWRQILEDAVALPACRTLWQRQMRSGLCHQRLRLEACIAAEAREWRNSRVRRDVVLDLQPLVELVFIGLPVMAGLAGALWPKALASFPALY